MLRFFLLICLLLYPATADAIALIHQELKVRLDPSSQRIDVIATLSAINAPPALPHLYRLNRHASIESVQLDGQAVDVMAGNGLMRLAAEGTYSSLTVRYHIRFPQRPPEETVGIEDPTFGVQATITDEGTFLSGDSAWHPVPVEAGFESLFSLTVEGPPGLVSVAGGEWLGVRSTGTGSISGWQTLAPRQNLSLAAGNYTVGRDQVGEIVLLTFFRQGNERLSSAYLQACKKYIDFYQDLLGPFPYPSYSVVENFYPTGYGLPGWTLLGSSVIRLPFILDTSLPHEITHAWWGNAIAVDISRGNWAEGLATYMADYYLQERRSESDALEYRRKILRDYATLAGRENDPLKDFRGRRSKKDQAIGYGKAAMVFHMLRRQLGDHLFWQALRTMAQTGRGEHFSWADVQEEFEKTSGTDLALFFDQWINRPGAPTLSLANSRSYRTKGGWQVTGVISQGNSRYSLRVPVRISTKSGHVDHFLDIREEKTRFNLMIAEEPQRMTVDPENHIFRLLDRQEIPRTINHLRASQAPLVVIARGAEELAGAAQDLLRGLQWHRVTSLPERDYDQAQYSANDILFIGRPETVPLPAGPVRFRLEDNHFSIREERYSGDEHTLFMVLRNDAHDTTWAFYLPASVEAARDNARRIPHYGRYSYLIFKSGHDPTKGTWEREDAPLTFNFSRE